MLLFTADEELGCVGAKKLADAGAAHPKFAIVGEPTSLRPIRANKGYCLAEVEITGRQGITPYVRFGDAPVVALAVLLWVLAVLAAWRGRLDRG